MPASAAELGATGASTAEDLGSCSGRRVPRGRPSDSVGDRRRVEPRPPIESFHRTPDLEEGVPDTLSRFVATDFTLRWRGRQRASQFEDALVRELLLDMDRSRVFELGTGTGRLTPAFCAGAREFVGVDLDLDLLSEVRTQIPPGVPHLLVHANLVHLPFLDGSASVAGLIRIYNHLTRPDAAFAEMRRVLVPGGRFVASAAVRPTLSTLELDLNEFLRRPPGVPFRGLTLRREPVVERRAGRLVVFFPTQAELDSVLARSRAEILSEYGVGIHDLYLLRKVPIPSRSLIAAGRKRPRSVLFPMRWMVGRWGPDRPIAVPEIAQSLACPRCRLAVGPVDLSRDWSRECVGCGFVLAYRDQILESVWDGSRGGPCGSEPSSVGT